MFIHLIYQFFGGPKDGHERKLPDNIQAQSYEWRFPPPYPQVVQASDYYVKYLAPFPVFIFQYQNSYVYRLQAGSERFNLRGSKMIFGTDIVKVTPQNRASLQDQSQWR
jgi:hypothetical protein